MKSIDFKDLSLENRKVIRQYILDYICKNYDFDYIDPDDEEYSYCDYDLLFIKGDYFIDIDFNLRKNSMECKLVVCWLDYYNDAYEDCLVISNDFNEFIELLNKYIIDNKLEGFKK